MKYFVAFTLVIPAIVACASGRKIQPARIGVVPLHNYVLNPKASFSDSVNYYFITTAVEFHKWFEMTKATRQTAFVPDFTSQSVVAIVLKPTERVVTLNITKAEIAGKDLNIYYSVTDTTTFTTYAQAPKVIATVPKSVSVKQVNFFKEDTKEKTLPANY
jgi:hypothetical protein